LSRRVPFPAADLEAMLAARHRDPFAVLGPHRDADGVHRIRVFQPGAPELELLDAAAERVLGGFALQHPEGLFEIAVTDELRDYRLRARWHAGGEQVFDDPYRHPPLLGAFDLWLFGEGTHLRPQRLLGAACRRRQRGGRLQSLGRAPPPDAPAARSGRVGTVPARHR
jgi:1,4-alpha-glucan branching enzyme